MGLILDSSIFIGAERQGKSIKHLLETIRQVHGDVEAGLSVVTIAELTHGIYRAKTEASRQRRLAFVEELINDVPVYPLTLEAARLAGRIEGEQAARGVVIPIEDLFIGVTALQQGFGVLTLNVRHFKMIPDLKLFSL